jgi:mono/diheme cytochrome c family protein
MQNILKVVFVLIFAAIGVFAVSTQPKNAINAVAAENSADAARDLYLRNCARCHGADGKAQTELGIREDATDLTQIKPSMAKSVRVITNGKEGMPGFGKKLTKAQINTIARYIRTL